MRRYIFAIATAAMFAIPTAAFCESVYIEPGGVRIGPSHHRYYNRDEGGRCAELRQACLHKEQLGEQAMGNCQRYRNVPLVQETAYRAPGDKLARGFSL